MVSSCVRPCILGNAGHISSAWQEVCQLHHFIIIALMTSSVWLHGFLSAFAWCQSATVYTQHALFGPHYLLPSGTGTNHAYSYFTTYYSDLIFVTQWAVLPIIADLTTSVQTEHVDYFTTDGIHIAKNAHFDRGQPSQPQQKCRFSFCIGYHCYFPL